MKYPQFEALSIDEKLTVMYLMLCKGLDDLTAIEMVVLQTQFRAEEGENRDGEMVDKTIMPKEEMQVTEVGELKEEVVKSSSDAMQDLIVSTAMPLEQVVQEGAVNTSCDVVIERKAILASLPKEGESVYDVGKDQVEEKYVVVKDQAEENYGMVKDQKKEMMVKDQYVMVEDIMPQQSREEEKYVMGMSQTLEEEALMITSTIAVSDMASHHRKGERYVLRVEDMMSKTNTMADRVGEPPWECTMQNIMSKMEEESSIMEPMVELSKLMSQQSREEEKYKMGEDMMSKFIW